MVRSARRGLGAAVTISIALTACDESVAPPRPRATPLLTIESAAQSSTTGVPIIDLGTLGGDASQANAINNLGEVVGSSTTASGVSRSFAWNVEGGMRDMLQGLVPDDQPSSAFDINDVGQIVGRIGYDTEDGSSPTAFRWSAAEGLRHLAGVDGNPASATAINSSGQAVGTYSTYNPETGMWLGGNPFLWTEAGSMRALAGVGPGYSAPRINDAGRVTGNDWGGAYLWTEVGGVRRLVEGWCSAATNINNSGWVVGHDGLVVDHGCIWGFGHGPTGFVWTEEGGVRYLPTLGGKSTFPTDINDVGQVVGYDYTASGQTHAFVWSEGAGMRNLGTLGGAWSKALGINNNGQIVGISMNAAGQTRAVLWTVGTSPPAAAPPKLTAVKDPVTPWSKVNLSWIDPSGVERSYEIQRCTGAACLDFAVIATAAANTASYTDATVTPATAYSYRVRATKQGGGSDLSNTAAVATDADPNAAPVARYTWSCKNTSCTFDGTRSTDDSGIVSYDWTFGDGSMASGGTVSHSYASRRSYSVTLTVRDNGAPPKSNSAACLVSATSGRNAASCR